MIEIKPTDWHIDGGYGPHFCCAFVPSRPQSFDLCFPFSWPFSWQRLATCCAFFVTCWLHSTHACQELHPPLLPWFLPRLAAQSLHGPLQSSRHHSACHSCPCQSCSCQSCSCQSCPQLSSQWPVSASCTGRCCRRMTATCCRVLGASGDLEFHAWWRCGAGSSSYCLRWAGAGPPCRAACCGMGW